MALLFGIKAVHQSTASNRPHVLAFNTARTVANDTLFELWNAATSAGIKAAVDLNGKYYSAALTAGDILYAVTGGVSNVKRLDSLAIGTAGQVLKVNSGASAPEWGTLGVAGGGTGLTTFTAAGAIPYATAATTLATLAVGTANQVLRVNAGATAPEWASSLSGLTLASPTITGTITGTPAWSNSQAITLSTAAQPSITSVGILTSLTVSGGVNVTGPISSSIGIKLAAAAHDIVNAVATDVIGIYGGNALANGGSVAFYGGSHASAANDIEFKAGTTSVLRWDNSDNGWEIDNGDIVVGAPTGGHKGAGTINAVAVYDDNTLLTDYVYERFYGLVPRDRPNYQVRSLSSLRAFTAQEFRLPMMPSRETFEKERSLGRIVSGLWEATELNTIYLFEHEDRIRFLEEENASLRAQMNALTN